MPASALLLLHCHTALHCGSGSAIGSIDLPVQRERHTGWPIVPATTLKGVIRDQARLVERNEKAVGLIEADKVREIEAVFGPSMKRNAASEHAGAVTFTDAYPLLFPVRSLKGLFAWVTCPSALDRFRRDKEIGGHADFATGNMELAEGNARVESGSSLLLDGGKLVLEEFEFAAKEEGTVKTLGEFLTKALSIERMKGRLAIISDDEFAHFVRSATEVQAHIALDYESKTVKKGALFYTEYVPPETIFSSLVLAEDAHAKTSDTKAKDVLARIDGWLGSQKLIQLGGDATTGKGLCRPILLKGAAAE